MFDWLIDLWHALFDPEESHPIDHDDPDDLVLEEPGTPAEIGPDDTTNPIDVNEADPSDSLVEEGILPADSNPPPEDFRPRDVVSNPDGRPSPKPKEPVEVEGPEKSRLEVVGMWAGSSTLRNPVEHVAFAKKHNVNRLDIIVNDHSAQRDPMDFTIRNRATIIRLAEECHKAGIQVAIMSWVMPHEDYIRQMGPILIELAKDVNAVEICLDAEEPWTLARKRMKFAAAGKLVGEVFKDRPCPLSITGIPYVATNRLKPLIDVADIAWVQSYSTSSSKRAPGTTQPRDLKLWAKKFGKKRPADSPPLQVKAALACYRQKGIKGHSPRSAILACADAVADSGQREVVFWWLVAMRHSSRVAKVISILRDEDFGLVEE
jgi:hypothetical protein